MTDPRLIAAVDRAIDDLRAAPVITASIVADHAIRTIEMPPADAASELRRIAAERLRQRSNPAARFANFRIG